MSLSSLRRFRAERLLRTEFDALKGRVLAVVRARLRGAGVPAQVVDLDACYAEAWQGLYSLVLAGQEIHNPAAWLSTVAFRRAIDDHRRIAAAPSRPLDGQEHVECEIVEDIDHRSRLRQVMEGIAITMSEREREAASLCYLQGLSREQAAVQMGLSSRSMRRLMEGRGSSRPGVSAKLAELTGQIAADRFCAEQASLMRAFAFGVLDPAGERHRVALAHWRQCPACRAYVRSLRGLAALLPPVFVGLPSSVLGSARDRGRAARGAFRTARDRGRAALGAFRTARLRMRASLRLPTLGAGASIKLGFAGAIAVLSTIGAFVVGRELLDGGAAARRSAHFSSQSVREAITLGAGGRTLSLGRPAPLSVSSGSRVADGVTSRRQRGASSAHRPAASAARRGAQHDRLVVGASQPSAPGAGLVREFGIERRGAGRGAQVLARSAPAGGADGRRLRAPGAVAEFGVE